MAISIIRLSFLRARFMQYIVIFFLLTFPLYFECDRCFIIEDLKIEETIKMNIPGNPTSQISSLTFWCLLCSVVLVSPQIGQFQGRLIQRLRVVPAFYSAILRASFIHIKEPLWQKAPDRLPLCFVGQSCITCITGKRNGIAKTKLD